jgi:hypothetical protein
MSEDNERLRDENGSLTREVAVLREQLRQALNREKFLNDNMTSVHARCTDLLNELRNLHAGIVLKGWTCPNPVCRVFNGEEKERRDRCRACDTEKPS